MATIPKYVYEDLKRKAYNKLNRKLDEIIKPFRESIQKQKDKLDTEFENNIMSNINKYPNRTINTWDGIKLEIIIPPDRYAEVKKSKEDLQHKLDKLINEIETDLNAQIDTWLLDIFTKASDNQSLTIPNFKVNKSKYKL